MIRLKGKEARCTFCSLGCFLHLSQSSLGTVEPEYGKDVPELRRGVCNRGNMTAELLGHVSRLTAAKLSNGEEPREVSLGEALGEVARAAGSSATTLLIDGNLPSEDIAAGLALAAASKGKVLAGVYLPAEDQAALDGLAASETKLMTPEDFADCDAVLIVGDAFATHPVISRPVHALRKEKARLPLVVIDSLQGRTGIFATHPLVVRPAAESRVLAALAGKLGVAIKGLEVKPETAEEEAGLPAGALAAAAEVIGNAKKLGVILRPEIGKAGNWDQIALLCGLIASAKGGGVTACLTYGNALGAYRLAAAAGAKLDKPGETTIVLGTDVVSVLSKAECTAMLDGVKTLVAAASLPSLTLGAADVVLPMAFGFETGGTTVTGSDEVITADVLAEPPGEAVSAGELVVKIAEALGVSGVERKVDASLLEKMPKVPAKGMLGRGQPETPAAAKGELLAVTQSDAVHFHTGSLTGQCAWPQYIAPCPVVTMAAADAESLGVADGETVKLTSSAAAGEATISIVKDQTAGVVVVPSGFAEMRGLFGWDGAHGTGPVAVKVGKCDG